MHCFLLLALILYPETTEGVILFSDQARAAGVADAGEGNGAAFGDYDGDGWPDLVVGRLGDGEQALLYRNRGDGTFADMSELLDSQIQTMGAAFVDNDGDGDLDLYLLHYQSTSQYYRNDGAFFSKVAAPDSVAMDQRTTGVAFGDYDGDGALDMFTSHRFFTANQFFRSAYREGFANISNHVSALRAGQDSFSATPFDYDNDGDLDLYVSNLARPNLLHRNEGRGTFRQIAEEMGLQHAGSTYGAFPADYDNDGDLDLLLANVGEEANALLRNDGASGFVEVGASAGLSDVANTLGALWADYDNDGDLDLLLANFGYPVVYENLGDGTFADVSEAALDSGMRGQISPAGMAAADYDRDGDVDVFMAGVREADMLWRNDGGAGGHWLQLELQGRQAEVGARVTVRAGDLLQVREYVAASLLGSQYGNLLHFGLGEAERVQVRIDWPSGQRQVIEDVLADQVLKVEEPLPRRDLCLSVLSPDPQLAWGVLHPEVEIANLGSETIAGATLTARIAQRARSVYEAAVPVPALGPGETTQLQLPQWEALQGGEYRFSFTLAADDDKVANNTWERVHVLHPFVDVAAELDVAHEGKGWAGAWGDYDGDGDLDLYLSNGGSLGEGENVLYRNDGAAGFVDVTEISGTADAGNGVGVSFADYDRDGHLDLFIARGGFMPPGQEDRLFRNNGDGTFADVSAASGLQGQQSSYGAVSADYDRDGYLDLYVTRLRGEPNQLYRNAGDGTFADVSYTHSIQNFYQYSGSAGTWADFDNDGDLDLYAGFFGFFDLFYADLGGNTYATSTVGAERGQTVGITVGDYDNDGDLDTYVVNRNMRSVLYANDVELGFFLDVGAESGTENFSPGTEAAFGDYDGDGDLDLFVTNSSGPNRVYTNLGDGTFADHAAAFGMADLGRGRGVLLGDYDNDGDPDVYVVNEGSPNRLYRNGGSAYNWLKVKARGVQSNVDAIGARIEVYAGGRMQLREINGSSGFSQNSRTVYFGLGEETAVDSLVIRWPLGLVETFRDLEINTSLLLVEGDLPTAVAEEAPRPQEAALQQNFPNPFNAYTAIDFYTEVKGEVRLVLYNTMGQKVRVLVDEMRLSGTHRVVWDGLDEEGRELASGIYYYRLWAREKWMGKSMVLLR